MMIGTPLIDSFLRDGTQAVVAKEASMKRLEMNKLSVDSLKEGIPSN